MLGHTIHLVISETLAIREAEVYLSQSIRLVPSVYSLEKAKPFRNKDTKLSRKASFTIIALVLVYSIGEIAHMFNVINDNLLPNFIKGFLDCFFTLVLRS